MSDFRKIKKFLTRFLFGIIIGASMMIPGLSGGTAAILLGVFYDIMNAVNNVFSDKKTNILYLLPYAIGGIIGFVTSTVPIKFLLLNYKFQFSFFIIGIIIGSVGYFVKGKKLTYKKLICIFLGCVPVICNTFLKLKFLNLDKNYLFLFIIGLLSAIALILPGISFTNILISFGCYDSFIVNVSKLNLLYLIVFVSSIIIGVLMFSNIIMKIYKKNPDNIDLILSGLILASVIDVYQGFPNGIVLFQCILLLIGGFCSSFVFSGFKK